MKTPMNRDNNEGRYTALLLAAKAKLTQEEKGAVALAVTHYHLNRLSVADGAKTRGKLRIRKIKGVPTPDELISSVVPGDYTQNREAMLRFHALTNLVVALADETEDPLEEPPFVARVEKIYRRFDSDTAGQRQERDAIVTRARKAIANLNKKIKEAKEAYEEAILPQREATDRKVMKETTKALSGKVEETIG